MLFCRPNETLNEPWVNHGISTCFAHTLGSSVVGGFILIFGLIQLQFYRKYATRVRAGKDPTPQTTFLSFQKI